MKSNGSHPSNNTNPSSLATDPEKKIKPRPNTSPTPLNADPPNLFHPSLIKSIHSLLPKEQNLPLLRPPNLLGPARRHRHIIALAVLLP